MAWWKSTRIFPLRSRPLKVVLYNPFFGQPMLSQLWGQKSFCRFMEGPAEVREADAVVFHLPGIRRETVLPSKRKGQLWVSFTMEADLNYPHQADPDFMNRFDISMSYRADADIPMTYIWPGKREEYLAPAAPKTEKRPAAAFISNSGAENGRGLYLEELEPFLLFDRYGKDRPTRVLEPDLGRSSKLEAMGRYKFGLAFENAQEKDYVTEKFYDCFVAGTVPVYRGAPNVMDYCPGEKCYIDTRDFGSPRELAAYLRHLDGSPDEYTAYHAWRESPLRPGFLRLMEKAWQAPLIRLDDFLRNRERGV